MTTQSDHAIADRIMRRRARVIPLIALIFISGQAVYFGNAAEPIRAVDTVKISAWLVWSGALLLLLATGGGLFRSKSVRALLNDETTLDHRRRAMSWGFWAAMLMCLGLYCITIYEPMTAREAIHLVLTGAIGAGLMRFAMLERRALKDA